MTANAEIEIRENFYHFNLTNCQQKVVTNTELKMILSILQKKKSTSLKRNGKYLIIITLITIFSLKSFSTVALISTECINASSAIFTRTEG